MSNQQVIYNLKHDYLEEEIKKAMNEHKYGVILVLILTPLKRLMIVMDILLAIKR